MFLRLLLGILLNLAVILGVLFVVGRLGGRIYRWAFDDLGCVKDCSGALKFHGWSGIVIFGLAGVGLAAGLLDLLFRPAADWWWRRLVRWCGTFVFLAIIAAILLRGIPQLIWWARTSRWGRVGNATQFAHAAGSVGARTASFALSLGHVVFRSGSGGKGSLPKKRAKAPQKFQAILQRFAIGLVVPL